MDEIGRDDDVYLYFTVCVIRAERCDNNAHARQMNANGLTSIEPMMNVCTTERRRNVAKGMCNEGGRKKTQGAAEKFLHHSQRRGLEAEGRS